MQHSTHKKEGVEYAAKVVENKSLADEENLEALETEVRFGTPASGLSNARECFSPLLIRGFAARAVLGSSLSPGRFATPAQIDILRKLDHPHIVGLKEVVLDKTNTYIIMELLGGGELFNRIVDRGPFPEPEAAKLFAQILLSMEYLHSLDIVHRDVKPENILYTAEGSNSVKLIDFGYAGVWSPEKELTGLCGTPDYVAPEVLTWYEDEESGTPYGKSSDLWSLGVLLYVILSGCSPFSADEEDEILKLVAAAQYVFHEGEFASVSANAKDMIAKLLVSDPSQRLTMPQMLSHPWLTEAVAATRAEIAAAKAAKSKAANGGAGAAKAPAKQQQPSTRTAGGGEGGVPTIEPRVEPVSKGGER